MKGITVKPYFNFFIFNKYNLGLWPVPVLKKNWYPKFSGYNIQSCAKYGIVWMGYLLELSYTKPYENCN